jgi:hypothetical protein
MRLQDLRQLAITRPARALVLFVLLLLPLSLVAHEIDHLPGDIDKLCITCQASHKKPGPPPGIDLDRLIPPPSAERHAPVIQLTLATKHPRFATHPARGPPELPF